MTPQEKIEKEILRIAIKWNGGSEEGLPEDYLTDAEEEIRVGEVCTGLPCEDDRHYEAKSVAMQCYDGSWVGWTYWFGGGKYGCPEEMDWISGAYDVEVEEVNRPVRYYTKVEKISS